MKNLFYLTTLTILLAFTACSGSKSEKDSKNAENGEAMKESDLPANPETPEDIAKVFYFHLAHLNYEKANEFYSGTLHKFDSDKVEEISISDLKAEIGNGEAKVTFINNLENEEVELSMMKVGDKWVINMYQTHSVNMK